MAEAGIGSREGKGPAVREGPAEHHSMSLPSICHGIPAKVFQVSFPAAHLPRFSCESVPGVLSRRPPATVFPRKCSRCPFPASHLPRNPCKSVPGVFLCFPPVTVSPRKRSRRETSSGSTFMPSTSHSIPADVLAVNGSW